MYASTSFTSHLIHDLLGEDFHSRRLLLQNPLNQLSPNSSINSHNSTSLSLGGRNFDANVVMVVTVLLCALICSLGLNSIIRCVLRCSNIVINTDSSSTSNTSSRLANKGIKKKALKTFPIVSYSAELNLPGLDPECVICLSEFTSGDKVRILPICNHGFHVSCIDKWLSSHSSCPKCRQCLIKTCQKIVGKQAHVVPVPQTIIRIEPLEPEGLVRNYREVS